MRTRPSTRTLIWRGWNASAEDDDLPDRGAVGRIISSWSSSWISMRKKHGGGKWAGSENSGYDSLERFVDPSPFVPGNEADRARRCEILMIQAMGLKKRLVHTHCQNAVVGISGGLDSLALLVTVKAFDMAGDSRARIYSVTMPCFGTTDRTYNNACLLTRKLGATLMEVDIRDAVNTHLGYQPRSFRPRCDLKTPRPERTQVLMDIANQAGRNGHRHRRHV